MAFPLVIRCSKLMCAIDYNLYSLLAAHLRNQTAKFPNLLDKFKNMKIVSFLILFLAHLRARFRC